MEGNKAMEYEEKTLEDSMADPLFQEKAVEAVKILEPLLMEYFKQCQEKDISTTIIMENLFQSAVMSTHMTFIAGGTSQEDSREFLTAYVIKSCKNGEDRWEAEQKLKEEKAK